MQPDSEVSWRLISPKWGSHLQQLRSFGFGLELLEAAAAGVAAGESSAKVGSLVLPALPQALDATLLSLGPCRGEDRLR